MSEPEPEDDKVFGDLNRLNRIIGNLDERGLVLALAAFAEQALADLIRSYLIKGKSTDQLIDGFNAPLGTFSARVKIAYSLGLITRRQHSDLDHLRQIRNEFAHGWEPISFADKKVASHISALHFSGLHEKFPTSQIEKVRTSLSTLLLELRSTTNQIKRRGSLKVIGHHVIAGVVGNLDHQIETCRKRLLELADELGTAVGERRRHLVELRYHWEGKLEIVRLNAPIGRQNEIKKLQAELEAYNVPPEV